MHTKALISTFVVIILFGLVSVQSFAVVRYEPQPLRTSFIRFVLLKRAVFSEIIPIYDFSRMLSRNRKSGGSEISGENAVGKGIAPVGVANGQPEQVDGLPDYQADRLPEQQYIVKSDENENYDDAKNEEREQRKHNKRYIGRDSSAPHRIHERMTISSGNCYFTPVSCFLLKR